MTNKFNPAVGLILCALIKLTSGQDPAAVQQKCCSDGQMSAQSMNCETSFVPMVNLNQEWNGYCYSVFSTCCNKRREENFCGQGQEIAEMGGDCGNFPVSQPGSEMVYSCCMACNAGMEIAKSSGTCSIQSMNAADSVYTTCCNTVIEGIRISAIKSEGDETSEEGVFGPQPEPSFANETLTTVEPEVEETAAEFCEKCAQGCGDGPDGKPICTCSSGFELSSDGKTCLDKDECLENPCNDTEICQNLVGGFDCIVLLSSGTESHSCQPGEVFDPTSNSCVHTEDNEIADTAIRNTRSSINGTSSNSENNNHVKDVDNPLGKNETSALTDPKCKEGYRKVDGHCADIDECIEKPDPCEGEEEGSECINYDGSYYCRKPDELELDELKVSPKNGTSEEDTDYEDGSGEKAEESQSCLTGYIWNTELKECEDEDECETGNYYCFTGEVCENTDGSYVCEKVDCEDDERLDETSQTCVPKDQCEKGYRFNPIRDDCENIDECLEAGEGKSPCEKGMACEDTEGSFKCLKGDCEPGYHLERKWYGKQECEDIDECTAGTHNCTATEVCVNNEGSFECDCNLGYQKSADGVCEDIDECTQSGVEGVNSCNSLTSFCVNTPGSFNCTCKEGFKQTSRNTCDDINECTEEEPCGENQYCIDKFGSFECKCETGWKLSKNGTCTNRDKPCHGIITDDKVCSCPHGFKLNSTNTYDACEDVNECDEGVECGKDEHCVNTFGNYECADISCPKGYKQHGDSKFWCYHEKFDIKACKEDDNKCLKQFEEPLSLTHSFVTTKSNVENGKLYEVFGLEKSGYYYKFLIHKVNVVRKPGERLSKQEETEIDLYYKYEVLKLERSGANIATLTLVKPVLGPREFTVEIDVISRDQPRLNVLHRSIVHVYVSEYDGKDFSTKKVTNQKA